MPWNVAPIVKNRENHLTIMLSTKSYLNIPIKMDASCSLTGKGTKRLWDRQVGAFRSDRERRERGRLLPAGGTSAGAGGAAKSIV